jgi:hypothetical protein
LAFLVVDFSVKELRIQKTIFPFYSELSLNPDLPTLAERCKLLTEILLDCNHSHKRSPYVVAWGLSGRENPASQNQCVIFRWWNLRTKRKTATKRVVAGRYRNEMRLLPGVKPCAAGIAF